MKICTYNLNGIRSASNKGLMQWISDENADFYCFQEIRAEQKIAYSILTGNQTQISMCDESENVNYFTFVNSGTVPGYAGTAILAKQNPLKVQFGLGGGDEDTEGRVTTLFYEKFAIVSCYVPNGGTRLEFKMDFFEKLSHFLCKLKEKTEVVFCSDVNIAHTEKDCNFPKECSRRSGFLELERKAFSRLLGKGFVDTFRIKNPDAVKYSWGYRSELKGVHGVQYRFDYILVNSELKSKIIASDITMVPYSDHLPAITEIDLNF